MALPVDMGKWLMLEHSFQLYHRKLMKSTLLRKLTSVGYKDNGANLGNKIMKLSSPTILTKSTVFVVNKCGLLVIKKKTDAECGRLG